MKKLSFSLHSRGVSLSFNNLAARLANTLKCSRNLRVQGNTCLRSPFKGASFYVFLSASFWAVRT